MVHSAASRATDDAWQGEYRLSASLFDRTSTSLRVRLIAIIAALIVPLAILQIIELYQVKTTRTRITQERAYELARAGAERYQDTIDDVRSVLNTVSHVADVISGSPETCSSFLSAVARSHGWARSVSAVNQQQRIICSSDERAIGFDLSGRPWFQHAFAQGGFSVSDFFVSQVSGAPTTWASHENSRINASAMVTSKPGVVARWS